ncbi:MAG: 1-acyl-sn-glycerol-3-phosphate acyltransferase [Lachnospiraceae bacterium]|nr:1-acyl-sn-glycerol-3-phosphate acyltransferase [Lachnospiraceae bacterium]
MKNKQESEKTKKNEKQKPGKYLMLDLARIFCIPTQLYYRMKREYVGESTKIQGGALIVANHSSFLDPLTLIDAFWYRRLYFLAAEAVMSTKLKRFLMGKICITIDRNISDIEAIRKAVSVLKEGQCLGMFPQGAIQQEQEVNSIKSGAILIAVQAKVPIVPVYIAKREHWWQRQKVVIGEPFYYKDYCDKIMPSMGDIQRLSQMLLERMQECETKYETLYKKK